MGDIVRVELAKPLRESSLKTGMELDGKTFRPVYVADRQVLPRGVHIHLVVGEIEKSKSKQSTAQSLANFQILGLSRKMNYTVTFTSAQVTLPSGRNIPLSVSLIQTGEVVQMQTHGDQLQAGESTTSALGKSAPGIGKIENAKKNKTEITKTLHPEMTLKLIAPALIPVSATEGIPSFALAPGELITIPAGTHARLLLLTALDASSSQPGDAFETRVEEPIVSGGQLLLSEGTIIAGHVRRVVPPRVLSRPASIFLTLDELVAPNGQATSISASLTGAAVKDKSAAGIDSEGGLHGGHPGVKEGLKDLVIAGGVEDATDEAVEIATHAFAPYVAFPLGLATLAVRHGQDVSIPAYSELEVLFNRPIEIPAAPDSQAPQQDARARFTPQPNTATTSAKPAGDIPSPPLPH